MGKTQYGEIFTNFPTIKIEVIRISWLPYYEYEKVRDYSYIGTDLFCENNGVNLGTEDYLDTGVCSCVDNASPIIDDVTKIEVCTCDETFTMLTQSLLVKSCAQSKITKNILTLGFNSFYDARIQFLAEK